MRPGVHRPLRRPRVRVAPPPLPPGYHTPRSLGRGGSGEVWAATDARTGRRVAIKLLHSPTPNAIRRFEREASALGLLDVPGVVKLLDQGVHEGQPYLVTELIEGAPFPAHLRSWSDLQPTVQQLLASLAAIHRAGLVHRDLKPENVLVTPDGRPVILDLGLTRGRPIGSTITSFGAIVGTPRYLSPEQIQGGRVDGRADLYALGVMLFEVLAGEPPHDADDWVVLWRQRLIEPARPLQSVAPTAPPAVSDLIDTLLERDPARRPATAEVVADLLDSGEEHQTGWLGPRDALDALLEAARAGRTAFLWGPRGSGRTHHLRQLESELSDEKPLRWLRPSQLPLGSLPGFTPDEPERDVEAQTRRAVLRFLREDGILLADDWDALDEWSRRLLDELTASGGLVAVRAHAEAVQVPSLPDSSLPALFLGPERLFHIPSDAAQLLTQRSGGTAGTVLRELRNWERLGHARRAGDQWRLKRSGLEALTSAGEAHPACAPCPQAVATELTPQERELMDAIRLSWPHASVPNLAHVLGRPDWQLAMVVERLQAASVVADGDHTVRIIQDPGWATASDEARRRLHLKVAAALPEAAPARLHHLLAGGGDDSLGTSLLAEIERRWEAGSRLQAVRLAEEGLRLLSTPPDALWLRLTRMGALTDATTLSRAIEDLLRPWRPDLADLVAAGRRARSGEPTQATVPKGLEIVDWYLRWELARRQGREQEAALLDAAEQWASGEDAAQVLSWKGLSAYRVGEAHQAMELHLRAADLRHTEVGRLSSLLNAAAAALEACALPRAEGIALDALRLARAGRHWLYEARAEWVLRSVENRRGAEEPDDELVDAVRHLDNAFVRGAIRLTEAMISARGGKSRAESLAREAVGDFEAANNPWGTLHATAMHAHLTQSTHAFDDKVLDCPIPSLALDVLALHTAGRQSVPEGWRAAARDAIQRMPPDTLELRRGYYSPSEAAVLLGVR